MAKIKQPTQPEPTQTQVEAPAAPDISLLIGRLAPLFAQRKEGEEQLATNSRDIIVEMREYRNENPTLERNDLRAALQQVVSDKYGIKLAAVQNDKKPGEKGYSAYTLVSALLSAAWPKGEAEEKKVAKAIAAGKGYVEIRKAASKPQVNRGDGDNKKLITKENFAIKLAKFLTQAQVDTTFSMTEILEMCDTAIEAIRKSPGGAPVES